LTLEPVKLKVRTGIAKFSAGDNVDGAKVLLNGKRIALPHSAELSGKKSHKLVATKEGFAPFEQEFEFEPGLAERKIELSLSPLETEELGEIEEIEGEADSEEVANAAHATVNASTSVKKSSKPTASKPKSKSSSAKGGSNGKLTLLSVPPVMVILDGRPIGQTPKRAVSVSPGAHSIVFVHPSKGRKRASAKVTAGGSKTVAVRF
jgi:serine/threonine-protein kinase